MKVITAKELESKVNEGSPLNIIDVREVDEVAAGKIPGAVNIPLGLVEFRMHERDKAAEYIMVCRSLARSGLASQFLESYGYNVVNMVGGMQACEGKTE